MAPLGHLSARQYLCYVVLIVFYLLQITAAQNHGVGSQYFVRASSWHETLRLSMEKARDTSPPSTAAAFTSPLTASNFDAQTTSSYSVVVNITGWKDLWLVNDYDQGATGEMLVRSWNRQPDQKLWFGVWGNPRILDASGNVLLYTLEDGFCTSYEIYDEDCNVNLFGKNNRYRPQVGSVTFDRGLTFGGNAAWHVNLPDSVRTNMRTFRATVGASLIREQPELKFRVVQYPDHKLRIREMWARTQIAFPAFFDEIELERNVGSIWDSRWSSISELALRYANAITYSRGNIKSVAQSKAPYADTAAELANVRALFHASIAVNKVAQIFTNFSAGNSFVDWFSSIESKEVQVRDARSALGTSYEDYGYHMNLLAEMKRKRAIVFQTFTASTDPFVVIEEADALVDMINTFTLSFPPWLHRDVMPKALRTINVSTTAEFRSALSSAKLGDHIVLANGFYTDIGNLIPTVWPANPTTAALQSPTYPLVIRAATPGGAVLSGNVLVSAQYTSNVLIKDLVIRHAPAFSLYLRDYVRNVRFSNCIVTGAKEASYIGGSSVNVRLDHLFLSSGIIRSNRGMIIDGPGRLAVGRNQLGNTFIGYRRRYDGNGAEFLQNYGPVHIHNNLVHRYVGEAAEIMKCAQPGCEVVNNTIPAEQTFGNFPGRLGAQGRVVGNFYLNKPIRVGGYADKAAIGNYVENAFISIGCQAYPCNFYNNQEYSKNTLVNSDIDSDTVWNPRAQFKVTMNRNTFISTSWPATSDIGTLAYGGSGNIWTPNALPTYLASSKMNFTSDANFGSKFFRDEYGIMRPRDRSKDMARFEAPLHPFDTRVGPSFAPVSVRINRFLASEWSFTTWRNPAANVVHSDFGAYVWPLEMFMPDGSRGSRRGAGVGGSWGFANFDSDSNMGGTAGVARGSLASAQNWNSFTLAGWFQTPVSSSSSGVIWAMTDPSNLSAASVIELSLSSGTLRLSLKSSSNSITVASPSNAFGATNKWLFFSVSFNPSRGNVQFWRGSATESPNVVSTTSISNSFGSIQTSTNKMLSFGASPDRTSGFVGNLDGMRLWISEDGPDRYDEATDNSADLSASELLALMRSDLGTFAPFSRESEASPKLDDASDPFYVLNWELNAQNKASDVANNDSSHNGTIVGSVDFSASWRGVSGARFSSGSSIWHVPHLDIDIRSYAERTVSLRFAAQSSNKRMVIYEEGSSTRGLNIYLFNNTVYAGVWDASTDISPHRSFIASAPLRSDRLNSWHSVALVINTTGVLAPNVAPLGFSLYLNGSLVGRRPAARLYAHASLTDGLSVGAHRGSTRFHDIDVANSTLSDDFGFNGLVSNLRVWNRALSASEISGSTSNGSGASTDTFGENMSVPIDTDTSTTNETSPTDPTDSTSQVSAANDDRSPSWVSSLAIISFSAVLLTIF